MLAALMGAATLSQFHATAYGSVLRSQEDNEFHALGGFEQWPDRKERDRAPPEPPGERGLCRAVLSGTSERLSRLKTPW